MKELFKKSTFDLQKYHLMDFEYTKIPIAYKNMLDRIDPDGLKELRVFRAQGNLENIQKLRLTLNRKKAKAVDMTIQPVDDIACLLKIYLYQMPEAIILPHIATSLLDQLKKDKKDFQSFASILLQLPDANYVMVKLLLRTLFNISTYSAINSMERKDLAFAMGPYLNQPTTEKKDKKKEEKEEKEMAKEKEKKAKINKEEKIKKKEVKRRAEMEKYDRILKIMETPYENAAEIRSVTRILIKHQDELFVDQTNSNSKGSFTR